MSQLDSLIYEIDTTIVFHCRSNSFANLSSDMLINEEASLHVTMLNKLKRIQFQTPVSASNIRKNIRVSEGYCNKS
jgi:hypothetical protein